MMEFEKKPLICVDFAGRVENDERFVKALGDQQCIDETFNNSSLKLRIQLHPGSSFVRGVYTVPCKTQALLLKIRVRRRRKRGSAESTREVLNCKIGGVIGTTYRGKGMAEFQYLPCVRNTETEPDSYTDISSAVIFDSIPERGVDWLLQPGHQHQYIVPQLFSRTEAPTDYHLRTTATSKKIPLGIIVERRNRPRHLTQHIGYEEAVPQQALPLAFNRVGRLSDLYTSQRTAMLQAFDERPVWNLMGIWYRIHRITGKYLTMNQVKFLLPTVCYLSLAAPWRAMHVRLGYDPKQHPQAMNYQVVDFRLHSRSRDDPIVREVKAKRTSSVLYPPGARVQVGKGSRPALSKKKIEEHMQLLERCSVFEPTRLPAQFVTFYQFCDIRVPQVQELLHQETSCTSQNGWLLPETTTKARAIMTHCCDRLLFTEEEMLRRSELRMKNRPVEERDMLRGLISEIDTKPMFDEVKEGEQPDEDEIEEALEQIMNSEESDVEEDAEEEDDDDGDEEL